ncbi:hypothetical protein J2128_002212 [Methanomicrobium sp. W14]|nr:hypothetical protein [Methanomicrobium sp. W14]
MHEKTGILSLSRPVISAILVIPHFFATGRTTSRVSSGLLDLWLSPV